jgi:hypothetical protein
MSAAFGGAIVDTPTLTTAGKGEAEEGFNAAVAEEEESDNKENDA